MNAAEILTDAMVDDIADGLRRHVGRRVGLEIRAERGVKETSDASVSPHRTYETNGCYRVTVVLTVDPPFTSDVDRYGARRGNRAEAHYSQQAAVMAFGHRVGGVA